MKAFIVGLIAMFTAFATSALTVSSGAVSFAPADSAALDSAVSNGVGNLWAGFSFVLPYVAVFLGISFVIGMLMKKLGGGRG